MNEDLLKLCEDTRYNFIRVDLDICVSSLNLGAYELSRGNIEMARREADCIATAILTIEHYLPGIPAARRKSLEHDLAHIKSALAGFSSSIALVTA